MEYEEHRIQMNYVRTVHLMDGEDIMKFKNGANASSKRNFNAITMIPMSTRGNVRRKLGKKNETKVIAKACKLCTNWKEVAINRAKWKSIMKGPRCNQRC